MGKITESESPPYFCIRSHIVAGGIDPYNMEMEFYFWDTGTPFSSGFRFYQVLTVQVLCVSILANLV